jgi:hypothetical protein
MSNVEWTILAELDPLLNVCPFYCRDSLNSTINQAISFATKKVSRSATPLIHDVIPVIDSLTTFFDKAIDNTTLHPAVRHAALRGVLMLNKYYAKTDDSMVYRIAMSAYSLSSISLDVLLLDIVLHPELKLDYFKKAKWLPEWIAEARRVITEEWKARYKPTPSATPTAASSSSSPRADVCFLDLFLVPLSYVVRSVTLMSETSSTLISAPWILMLMLWRNGCLNLLYP